MNEDLEPRLRARLHEELPPAPAATRAFLARLPLDRPKVVRRRGASTAAVAAAIVGIGLIALAAMAGMGGTPNPLDGVVSPPTTALPPSPTSSQATSRSPDPLGSLTIHSVSGLLDLRAAGRIHGERVALRGFWSDRTQVYFLSCFDPDEPPGELEIACRDGTFGITERDEPILRVTMTVDGERRERTDGPALTPFVEEALAGRLDLAHINGQPYPPVPIVVVGHFDDPRAEQCRIEFRQRCRDRLVLDEIMEFRPEAVPTPGVTPSPTPFPFADPPPVPFTKADCFGDVPYSFIGWAPVSRYQIDNLSDDVVFIMVTRDEVRVMGSKARKLCYAREGDQGVSIQTYPLP